MGGNHERVEIALGWRLSLRSDAHPSERTASTHRNLSLYGLPTHVCKPFSLSIGVPSEGFDVTEGEPVIGDLHGPTRRYFCPRCMNWMFTRPEGTNEFVNLRPTMLDEHGWIVPFIEFWTQEKLPWANTPSVYSYATEPVFADYAKLLEEFARNGSRPS
jgi:hypothetical protein